MGTPVIVPMVGKIVSVSVKVGDKIKGKVISFSPFGAFVEVMPKIRGLCHISEFASQKEMEDALKIGDKHEFEILSIEPKEYRMSLKLVK